MTDAHRAYRLVDADQHYYEPDDCFTRHLDPALRDRGLEVRHNGLDGLGRVYLSGERLGFFSVAPGESTGRPGLLQAYFKSEGRRVRANEEPIHGTSVPEFTQRDARLKALDEHDVEAALMLPSLGVGVEHEARRDSSAWYAMMRSFNQWVEEDWGYGLDGRIFGVPLTSLIDLDEGINELDRVIRQGTKVVLMRPGPLYGRSPADPYFDPFWNRVQEANIVVAFHLCSFGYAELYSTQWGHEPNPATHRQSAFQSLTCRSDRAMHDMAGALILDNLFSRMPKLRFMIIELGAAWIPSLLRKMDRIWRQPNSRWPGGRPEEAPSEIFRRHFWASPYPEEDFKEIADAIGVSQVVMGSDWPHPEGLERPSDMLEQLSSFSANSVQAIMRDNTAALLGIR
jgi:predicted TIM-barrel fold metal-dependent hydrolase